MGLIDVDEFALAIMDASSSSVDEDTILDLVDSIPTVDAIPVGRCRECKHWKHNMENDTYCSLVGGLSDPEENDFCCYGERKE